MIYNNIGTPIATKGFRLNGDAAAVGLDHFFAGGAGAADLRRFFRLAPGLFVLLVAKLEAAI